MPIGARPPCSGLVGVEGVQPLDGEPDQRALADPETRKALRRYRLRCLRAAVFGFVGFIVGGAAVNSSPSGDPKGIAGLIALVGISWGGLATGVGVWTLLRSLRMAYVMRRHPWVTRTATYLIAPFGANGQPAL